VIEDHLDYLRRKAAIWLPLIDRNPESAQLLRQMIEEDLDGMPAVSLMAVKMVTGALSEPEPPGTDSGDEVSNRRDIAQPMIDSKFLRNYTETEQ